MWLPPQPSFRPPKTTYRIDLVRHRSQSVYVAMRKLFSLARSTIKRDKNVAGKKTTRGACVSPLIRSSRPRSLVWLRRRLAGRQIGNCPMPTAHPPWHDVNTSRRPLARNWVGLFGSGQLTGWLRSVFRSNQNCNKPLFSCFYSLFLCISDFVLYFRRRAIATCKCSFCEPFWHLRVFLRFLRL